MSVPSAERAFVRHRETGDPRAFVEFYDLTVGAVLETATRIALDLAASPDPAPTWVLARGTKCTLSLQNLTLGAEYVLTLRDDTGGEVLVHRNVSFDDDDDVLLSAVLAPGAYEATVAEATGRGTRERLVVGATECRFVLRLPR